MVQIIESTITELINLAINPNSKKGTESFFLFYFKLFCFFIIIIITFSFGLLPLYFANYREGTIILNYANPFSGGIFIGIGLFHLLPDASYNFEQYYKTQEGKNSFFYNFPMSYFIVFLSYSFILYLEKVAFSSDEIDLKNNKQKINPELIEPLINNQEDNKEKDNYSSEYDKLIPTILSKRNKGK